MILERKRRRFNENIPNEKPNGDSQSDIPISEKHTVKSINKSTLVAQGLVDDDDEMEMLTNDGDISMSVMNEEELTREDEKKFLYARVVHSNNLIQYHMHQKIKQQRVVDKYKNMTMEGMD